MQRLFYILLAVVGLSLCGLDEAACHVVSEPQRQGSIESLYREQLKVQERCNSDAVRTHTISVPATTVQIALSTERYGGGADVAVYGRPEQPISVFDNENFVHRLSSGDRVADYYLYALCRLRI